MKVGVVFPVLPPVLDGIGDYTAKLASTLSATNAVTVYVGRPGSESIEGVTLEHLGSDHPREFGSALARAVGQAPPDWLIVQYNPFSYGRWGLNPFFPMAIRKIRESSPRTRIALMVHEPFVPVSNWKFAVMTVWQRWQLWQLGHSADLLFFSIAPWAKRFETWFPGKPLHHLPVGANIPLVNISRKTARYELGLDNDCFVLGVFGSAHASRLLGHVRAAAEAVVSHVHKMEVLYVGPDGQKARAALQGLPLIDTGALAPDEVSVRFAAMDLYLAPFRKGVSSRRGSFMVGLQHGIPTISTYGSQTDADLRRHDRSAFFLAPDNDAGMFARNALGMVRDPSMRTEIGQAGKKLFELNFSWSRIAGKLIRTINEYDASTKNPQAPAVVSRR